MQIRFIFAILVLVCSAVIQIPSAAQQTREKKMPKEEVQDLMNFVMPVAQDMLKKYGEFYPYGGVINSKGETVLTGVHNENERPSSMELIELITKAFQTGAKAGEYRATAIVYDVRIVPPGSKEKSDAIAINLDHADGLSITVLLPYQIREKGEVTYGTLFAQNGESKIFGK